MGKGDPPSGSEAVPKSLALDLPSLRAFLRKSKVPAALQGGEEWEVEFFSAGQSNPTYLLKVPGNKNYVLRKQPPGKLLPGAHDMHREYSITAYLHHTGVPVASPVVLCQDKSVLGTDFYICEFVQGEIYRDAFQFGADYSQDEIDSVYTELARSLASLHRVPVVEALQRRVEGVPSPIDHIAPLIKRSVGKDYLVRQLNTWMKQYTSTRDRFPKHFRALNGLEELHRGLLDNLPQYRPVMDSIVHGDYRIDNVIFQPKSSSEATHKRGEAKTAPRKIKALLDWELWTLGDGMADLANLLGTHFMQAGPTVGGFAGMADPSSEVGGNMKLVVRAPSWQTILANYCTFLGVNVPGEADWLTYMSFACYRFALILHGVYTRVMLGNASGQTFRTDASKEALWRGVQDTLDRGTSLRRAAASAALGPFYVEARLLNRSDDAELNKGFLGLLHRYESRVPALRKKLVRFVNKEIIPMEKLFEEQLGEIERRTGSRFGGVPPIMEELKAKAKAEGLWNLFLPPMSEHPLKCEVDGRDPDLNWAGYSNLEYATLCEVTGRSFIAPEVFNCAAPDTGNMEVLLKYGNAEQQRKHLIPLLKGEWRSAFAMTEPLVASSDATNIATKFTRGTGRDGSTVYKVEGRKWYITGAMHPLCRVCIVMGRVVDPENPNKKPAQHEQQTMLAIPFQTPGVRVVRHVGAMGYDDAPGGHAEVVFEGAEVKASECLLMGEGKGFAIAQGRLGPGRVHHCMRMIGLVGRCLEETVARAHSRVAFGQPLSKNPKVYQTLAECKIELEQARMLVLKTAMLIDLKGNKGARMEVAMIKVAIPRMACKVIDECIQIFGAAGMGEDFIMARAYVGARSLRIADGPDEVHLTTLAKQVMGKKAHKL